MTVLEITGVAPDPSDPTGQSFILSFNRELHHPERQTLPVLLSKKFSPTEANGPSYVTIRQASAEFFTNPDTRASLKALVTEAAAEADRRLAAQRQSDAAKTAQMDEMRLNLSEIDWKS